MKKLISKHGKSIFVTLTALVCLTNGCRLNDSAGPTERNTPPEIPPANTLVMDFSDFIATNQASYSQTNSGHIEQLLSRDNWGWAATNVMVWNTLLTITFITPVAAFVESFKHEPVQQPDDSWIWTYNFNVFGVIHTAELHAKTIPAGIRWDMYISKENDYSNYHWFFGESNLVTTEGTWTLNSSVAATPFIFIEWHRNPKDSTSDIKYTNVIPDAAENGGYIFYGTSTDAMYDAFYDIYNKGKDNHSTIKWNRTTKAGQIKDALHFGDNDWHCWNTLLEDIDCQ
ncbi:MAG: hypothetical protein ACE5HX_04885 [bacterium]